MRPRPGGVNRARSEDKPRPDRDPEPVRPRRQGHGDSLAVCVMRLAPATMREMAIAMLTRITRCFDDRGHRYRHLNQGGCGVPHKPEQHPAEIPSHVIL